MSSESFKPTLSRNSISQGTRAIFIDALSKNLAIAQRDFLELGAILHEAQGNICKAILEHQVLMDQATYESTNDSYEDLCNYAAAVAGTTKEVVDEHIEVMAIDVGGALNKFDSEEVLDSGQLEEVLWRLHLCKAKGTEVDSTAQVAHANVTGQFLKVKAVFKEIHRICLDTMDSKDLGFMSFKWEANEG